MKKQIIKNNLIKHQIIFKEQSDAITLNLDLGLEIKIQFLQNEEVKITDKLKRWNPLTGILEMSLKKSMIYNTILLLILVIFFVVSNLCLDSNLDFSFVFIGFLGFIVFWTNYYQIKSENLKTTLMRWIDEIPTSVD